MAITQITNYQLLSTARLLAQFRTKAKIEGWVASYANQIQDLEDALWALYSLSIDTAVYPQLDDIYGTLVGVARLDSADDAAYRVRIKARIAVNRSSGTGDDLLRIAALVAATGTVLEIEQSYPCNFELRLTGVANDGVGEEIATLIHAAKAAGVRGVTIYQASTDANTFTWDGTAAQGWDTGLWATGSEG